MEDDNIAEMTKLLEKFETFVKRKRKYAKITLNILLIFIKSNDVHKHFINNYLIF